MRKLYIEITNLNTELLAEMFIKGDRRSKKPFEVEELAELIEFLITSNQAEIVSVRSQVGMLDNLYSFIEKNFKRYSNTEEAYNAILGELIDAIDEPTVIPYKDHQEERDALDMIEEETEYRIVYVEGVVFEYTYDPYNS